MTSALPALPPEAETIAELRQLYRAAEARAARLRLLSGIGRDLAVASPEATDETLQRCVRTLAFFLGGSGATLDRTGARRGIPVHAPGDRGQVVATFVLDGCPSLDDIPDPEDRETCRMCLELFGVTIDRMAREQERTRLFSILSDREQRLELLVGRFFSAQEEERRRVSRELHDGVAQTATALVRLLEGGSAGDVEDLAAAERARLVAIARGLLKELRGVIAGLRPTLLDDLGLAAALQSLADGLRADGYRVSVRLDPDAARLPHAIETALYRVAQEAVANVRKHAGAGCAVTIELDLAESRAGVLRVRDTGQGPPAGGRRGVAAGDGNHVGIEVMQERMAAIGGSLEWTAGERGGVTVTATLPEDVGP